MSWYVGMVVDGGAVLTLVGFASETEPQFTNDEAYPGIAFATEDAAVRMSMYLNMFGGLGVDMIVYQE